MAKSLGKKFEQKFKEDWLKIGDTSIDRLYDVTSGYKAISQVSDYICYKYPKIFYVECKTHKGNTFPISALTQYDKMIEKKGITGVVAGVVIWFYEHEKDPIVFVPLETFEKLKNEDKKSFNIKMIGSDDYPCTVIPSVKRRTFYDSDYSVLLNSQ